MAHSRRLFLAEARRLQGPGASSWPTVPIRLLRSSAASSKTHYEILGVSSSCSQEQIKKAFYRHALTSHPDTRTSPIGRAATAGQTEPARDADEFVQLALAYELLSDPVRRDKYDAELKAEDSGKQPSWARQYDEVGSDARRTATGRRHGYHAQDDQFSIFGRAKGYEWFRRMEREAAESSKRKDVQEDTSGDDHTRPFGGYNGIARRAAKQGSGSVWAALQHAHDGPRFSGGLHEYPYAFELDERNDSRASHDILHMGIGGGPLLGVVRGRGLERLPMGDDDDADDIRMLKASSVSHSDTETGSSGIANPHPDGPTLQEKGENMWSSLFSGLGLGAPASSSAASSARSKFESRRQRDPNPAGTSTGPDHDNTGATTTDANGVEVDGLQIAGSYDHIEFIFQGKVIASAMMFGNGGDLSTPDDDSGNGGSERPRRSLNPYAALDVGQLHNTDDAATAATDLDSSLTWESSSYFTIYRHFEDGSRGPPLAHVLGARGVGMLNFRRVVSCDLVNPFEDAAATSRRNADWLSKQGSGAKPSGGVASHVEPSANPSGVDGAAVAYTQHRHDVTPEGEGSGGLMSSTAGDGNVATSRYKPFSQAWYREARGEVKRRVFQVAMDEFAQGGRMRRNTIRIEDISAADRVNPFANGDPWAGIDPRIPKPGAVHARSGNRDSAGEFGAGRAPSREWPGFAASQQTQTGVSAAAASTVELGVVPAASAQFSSRETPFSRDSLAEKLCAPRQYTINDDDGGIRALPRVKQAYRDWDSSFVSSAAAPSQHGAASNANDACGSGDVDQRSTSKNSSFMQQSGRKPSSSDNNPFAGWNMSHWFDVTGRGTTDMPRLSAHHSRFARWDVPHTAASASASAHSYADESARTDWQFDRGYAPPGSSAYSSNQSTASSASSRDTWWTHTCPHSGETTSLPHDPAYIHPRFATHTLVSYRTPGVSHIRFMRNIDGRNECTATRVRLPDSRYWLWAPRSLAHQRGGYTFEISPRRDVEPALHPAVYILSAAVLTLQREFETALKKQSGWRNKMMTKISSRLPASFSGDVIEGLGLGQARRPA